LAAAPPSEDGAKNAIHRKGSGRCPVRIKRLSLDVVLRYGDALADLFCEHPDDVVSVIPYDIAIGFQAPDKEPRINSVEVLTRDAQWTDEWGTPSAAAGPRRSTPRSRIRPPWTITGRLSRDL
jgi:hypothetical protein